MDYFYNNGNSSGWSMEARGGQSPSPSPPSPPASQSPEIELRLLRAKWDATLWALLEPYKYKALGSGRSIRVLQVMLYPQYSSQCIICCLHEIELEKAHQGYDALSYAWEGRPLTKHLSVFCDSDESQEPHARLAVTQNVEDAIRRLQDHYAAISEQESFLVWIDALCINQEDVLGRGDQVAMMASIYDSADNVVVWLGRGDALSDKVMKTMLFWEQLLGSLNNDKDLQQWFWERLVAKLVDFTVDFGAAIAERQYWTRVWTLQEFARGRDRLLLCGDVQAVSLHTLCDVIGRIHSQDISTTILTHVYFYLDFQGTAVTISPKQRIVEAQYKQASNPMDKIFGLRSLRIKALDQIEVDYSTTLGKLYHSATWSIIKDHSSLWLLETNNFMRHDKTSPSWTVDFSQNEWPFYPESFAVHSHGEVDVNFTHDRGVLYAKGRSIGRINYWFESVSNSGAVEETSRTQRSVMRRKYTVHDLHQGRLDSHLRMFREWSRRLLTSIAEPICCPKHVIEMWHALISAIWREDAFKDVTKIWLRFILGGLKFDEQEDVSALRSALSGAEVLEWFTCALCGHLEEQTPFLISEYRILGLQFQRWDWITIWSSLLALSDRSYFADLSQGANIGKSKVSLCLVVQNSLGTGFGILHLRNLV